MKPPEEHRVLPDLQAWVWPFMTRFQTTGAAQAVAHGNFHLHWACGAGKTLAAILWALSGPEPTLIVCMSSAREQWAQEVRRFVEPATVRPFILYPESARRAGDEALEAYLDVCLTLHMRPFVVVAWSGLRDLAAELDTYFAACACFWQRPAVVWDESHEAKAHKHWRREEYDTQADAQAGIDSWLQGDPDGAGWSPGLPRDLKPKREGAIWRVYFPLDTLAARAAFRAPQTSRRICLTATFAPDRPRDFWAQGRLAEPDEKTLRGGYWPWAEQFCGAQPDEYGRWKDTGASNVAMFRAWLDERRHVVTDAEMHAQLPSFRRILTRLSPTDLAARPDAAANRAVRDAMRNRGDASWADEGIDQGARSMAIRRALLDAAGARKIPHVLRTVPQLIAEGKKVLVMTGRKVDAEKIGAGLERKCAALLRGNGAKLWMAHGETPSRTRAGIREDYMAHEGGASLTGTYDCWGQSLNLQSTDWMVVVTLPWTWGKMKQLEGRGRRLGQLRAFVVEYLFAMGTIDDRMFHVVGKKLKTLTPLLDSAAVQQLRDDLRGGSARDILDQMVEAEIAAWEAQNR